MADSQQSTQVPQVISMPEADAMPVNHLGNTLKRAAEGNNSLGPEAKQARLEDTAAEGAPSALEDLLPQPAVAQPGVAEHIPAAIVPLVTVVEGSSAGQQAVQPLTVAAAGPAVGPPAATPAAAPSSTPAAASTAPTSLPAAVEAVVVGAVVPAAAAAPAALAASQQVQPKTEDVRPKQEAGEYQGRGGRGGGRGGRGSRGRGRGGADYNRSYGPFIEEGQEPTGDASHFKMPADVVLKQEIPLPRRMASCVIGIKGTTVSKLRRDSGSKIHVRPGIGQAELDQVVEIEGSIEAVVTCIRLVDELVRAEDPNYKITPKSEVTSKFYVLPEMIGPAIIGKAGTHAKHIRERTGVRIEVIPPADHATRQHIVLHGTAERVREAYHLLLGNIRKYGPALPAGAIPTPLPFPNRPPTAAERASGGRGGRSSYAGRGGGAQPPPPPSRGAAAASTPSYRYDDYSAAAAPYSYAAAAPGATGYPAAAAPVAAPYAAPAAAAPDPNAAALAAAAAGGQQMYILQDGVLKPLTVMYQQPGAAAAAPAAPTTAQLLQGMAGYGPAPGAAARQPAYGAAAPAAPTSTGAGGQVLYQQPGGSYAYAPAPGPEAAAAPAAGAWPAQQLGGVATSQAGAAPSYATAGTAPPAYAPQAVPGAPSVQYVQYAYQP